MQFSAMTMNMFVPGNDDPGGDNRIIDMAVAQSIWLAELGYHVWFTDHHFRGPWHSNPMQFAAYVAPLIPRDRTGRHQFACPRFWLQNRGLQPRCVPCG